MARDIVVGALMVLILGAAFIPHYLPDELKDPFETKLIDWLIGFGILWGVALIFLLVACQLGPEQKFDEEATVGDMFHWKHLPGNWREILFLIIVVWGFALFLLTIAYISAFGGPGELGLQSPHSLNDRCRFV